MVKSISLTLRRPLAVVDGSSISKWEREREMNVDTLTKSPTAPQAKSLWKQPSQQRTCQYLLINWIIMKTSRQRSIHQKKSSKTTWSGIISSIFNIECLPVDPMYFSSNNHTNVKVKLPMSFENWRIFKKDHWIRSNIIGAIAVSFEPMHNLNVIWWRIR